MAEMVANHAVDLEAILVHVRAGRAQSRRDRNVRLAAWLERLAVEDPPDTALDALLDTLLRTYVERRPPG